MEREAQAVEEEAVEVAEGEAAPEAEETLDAAELESAAESGADPGESGGEVEPARQRLDSIVESLLFASSAPLPIRRMVDVLNGPTAKEIKAALARLMAEYDGRVRGIELGAVAGGFQFRTAPANADYVRTLLRERPARLGRAALETLAIIAYKQPATRPEIEAIRGVDADSAISTLLAKRLIKIAGRKEAVGRPLMYATTPEFLETFGIADLAELPALKEIGPVAEPEDEPDEPEIAADAERRAPSEAPESRGGELEASGGGDDPLGASGGERPHDPGAGDEGGPEPGPHHG